MSSVFFRICRPWSFSCMESNNVFKAVGQRRGKILPDRDQLTWKRLGSRQDSDVRSLLRFNLGKIVVTEGAGRRFFAEHPVDQFSLGIGKKITDVRRRSMGI